MEALFSTGRVADLILLTLALEAVLLGGAFLAHLLDVGLRWHTHVRRT